MAWAEWNGRYRDVIRRFVRGDPGLVGEVATRIAGSADLYAAGGRLPANSINFITCHDGFTLNDLVSYNDKHNESQRRGQPRRQQRQPVSWNCGVEGDTGDAAVLGLRHRQARNFLSILFLSQGVPMILAGDEVLRSQRGNNNAWCQDNELSWFDWQVASRAGMLRFVRESEGDVRTYFGNLLTLPVGEGLMYVQPLYAARDQCLAAHPAVRAGGLRRGSRHRRDPRPGDRRRPRGRGDDSHGADRPGHAHRSSEDPGDTPAGRLPKEVQRLLNMAAEAYAEADRLQAAGDTAGWAAAIEEARDHVDRALRLLDERNAETGTPEPTDKPQRHRVPRRLTPDARRRPSAPLVEASEAKRATVETPRRWLERPPPPTPRTAGRAASEASDQSRPPPRPHPTPFGRPGATT